MAAILLVELWSATWGEATFDAVKSNVAWDFDSLRAGHFWVAWVGLWLQPAPGVQFTTLLMLVLCVGALELRRGSRTAALAYFVWGPIATILATLALLPMQALGVPGADYTLSTPDTGLSESALFCGATFLVTLRPRWAFLGVAASAPFLLLPFLADGQAYAFGHFFAFVAGLAAAPLLFRNAWSTAVRGANAAQTRARRPSSTPTPQQES
jgi:hypothetical protein